VSLVGTAILGRVALLSGLLGVALAVTLDAVGTFVFAVVALLVAAAVGALSYVSLGGA
jgi:hypothetical protein